MVELSQREIDVVREALGVTYEVDARSKDDTFYNRRAVAHDLDWKLLSAK